MTLARMSVERLQFEHEKRAREISVNQTRMSGIQTKISRLSRELDEMYREYEADRAARPHLYEEAGCYPGGLDSIPRDIERLERDIQSLENQNSELEDEMSAIESVLSDKWGTSAHA